MAAPEEKHRFVQENSMLMAYPYKTVHRDKMKSPVNQKCCFHLFVLAVKTCSIEANTTLALEDGTTGQNWIPCLFDIHWLNTIFHSKNNGCIAATKMNYPSDWRVCFQVLVVYCYIPDVQTWMCTAYTQDLKPKVFPQYIRVSIYIYISLQLLSLKTKIDINTCLKCLMFHISQYIKPKNAFPQRPGLKKTGQPRSEVPEKAELCVWKAALEDMVVAVAAIAACFFKRCTCSWWWLFKRWGGLP